MYTNTIVNTKKKLTESDIYSFEKKYKVLMPEDIKKHYLQYNGGYPEKSVFLADNGKKYVLNYFFSICCGEGLAFENIAKLLNDRKVFPQWLIPFANDIGGNLFCYSTKEDENGAIYYYNHEFEYGENPEKYICFLSDSIVTFINSLVEDDEE